MANLNDYVNAGVQVGVWVGGSIGAVSNMISTAVDMDIVNGLSYSVVSFGGVDNPFELVAEYAANIVVGAAYIAIKGGIPGAIGGVIAGAGGGLVIGTAGAAVAGLTNKVQDMYHKISNPDIVKK